MAPSPFAKMPENLKDMGGITRRHSLAGADDQRANQGDLEERKRVVHHFRPQPKIMNGPFYERAPAGRRWSIQDGRVQRRARPNLFQPAPPSVLDERPVPGPMVPRQVDRDPFHGRVKPEALEPPEPH